MSGAVNGIQVSSRSHATLRRLQPNEFDARTLAVIIDACRVSLLLPHDGRTIADLLSVLNDEIVFVAQMPAQAPVGYIIARHDGVIEIGVLATYERPELEIRRKLIEAATEHVPIASKDVPERSVIDRRAAILRRARPTQEDANSLSRVSAACFLETFSDDHTLTGTLDLFAESYAPAVLLENIDDPTKAVWLLECDGRPVGHAMLAPALGNAELSEVARDQDFFLKRIYVLDSWQGTGAGSALYKAIRAEAGARGGKRLILTVYTKNDVAIKFYERKGFRIAGQTVFKMGEERMVDHIMLCDL